MTGLKTRLDAADEKAPTEQSDQQAAGGPAFDQPSPFSMDYDLSELKVDHETGKEIIGSVLAVSNLL